MVVAYEGITGHLSEQAEESGDEDSSTHSGGAEEIDSGHFGVLHFKLDCGLYLCHFGLDEYRFGIAFSVIFHEDRECFLMFVFADEPSGTFRQETNVNIQLLFGTLAFASTHKMQLI